jgi:hypothetical protein
VLAATPGRDLLELIVRERIRRLEGELLGEEVPVGQQRVPVVDDLLPRRLARRPRDVPLEGRQQRGVKLQALYPAGCALA